MIVRLWLDYVVDYFQKIAKNVACATSGNEVLKRSFFQHLDWFLLSTSHVIYSFFFHGLKVGTNKCGKAGESLKEKDGEDKPCSTNRCGKAVESLKEEDGGNKPCNTNRRRQSKSLCNLLDRNFIWKLLMLSTIPSSLFICMLLQALLILNHSKPRRGSTRRQQKVFVHVLVLCCNYFSNNNVIFRFLFENFKRQRKFMISFMFFYQGMFKKAIC